jgi:hypothetical protein
MAGPQSRTTTPYRPIFAAARRDGADFPDLFVAPRSETPGIRRSSLLDLGKIASRRGPLESS